MRKRIKGDLIPRAAEFARIAHIRQKRKYTNAPYIVHCAAVAEIVHQVTDDENMIAAAWLHDTVEDTSVTLDEIRETFGVKVATLVGRLTDVSKPEDGNRDIRKKIDREHTAQATPEAKTIKLADLIDNTSSIVPHDPDFARVYLKEKELLLPHLKQGNKKLLAIAKAQLANSKRQLSLE